MASLERTLTEHPFLAGLDGRHVGQLAGLASEKSFRALQMIFNEGEEANHFYLVRKGSVAIEVPALGFDAVQLQTLGPGEVLGWSWLLPPYQWHFSARAVEPTDVIALDGKALRARCEEDHELGYQVLKRFAGVMAKRLEATRLRMVHVPDPGPSRRGGTPPANFAVPDDE